MAPVLILIGFTAMVAQVALMRELIVVCAGSEMALGLMLASWLFWTAVGSAVAPRRTPAAKQLAVLNLLCAVVLPATIVAVRASRLALRVTPGEMLSPGAVLAISFLTLSLLCLLGGAMFSTGVRLYSGEGAVYLLETLGAGLGGICTALLFLLPVSPFQIAFALAWLSLVAALFLLRWRRAALAAVVLLPLLPLAAQRFETASRAALWRGFQVVASRNSRYGNLVITRTLETATLYANGLPAFHVPDPAVAEEAVHYALLEHAAPRRLLLFGGGVDGSLTEAFRHPTLERADYVELDPAVLSLAREQFPKEWRAIASDRRITIHSADGRRFLRDTASIYDVIIVDLPDPQTAQLNRFYTLEFFRLARRRLAPGGLLALQLSASEDYISPELASLLRCIRRTLAEVFREVIALAGSPVHLLASTTPGTLTSDAGLLIARLKQRHLATQYVREYFLPFRLSRDRMQDLDVQLRPTPDTPLNRDFFPIACFLNTALWMDRFQPLYQRLFATAAKLSFPVVAATVALLFALFTRAARRPQAPSVAAMGFTTIGLEILLLLGFQALYGYVYQQLAVITAGFMAGMALGTWGALRSPRAPALYQLQCMAAVAPALLCLAMPHTTAALFALLSLLGGLLGGCQFAVASRGNLKPGRLYAADLAGACLGAVLFSAWLIPAFGFFGTAALMAAANLAPAIGAWRDRRTPAQ